MITYFLKLQCKFEVWQTAKVQLKRLNFFTHVTV